MKKIRGTIKKMIISLFLATGILFTFNNAAFFSQKGVGSNFVYKRVKKSIVSKISYIMYFLNFKGQKCFSSREGL